MTEPPEYELKTMADLFKIPKDRFDNFMVDLKSWREIGGETVDMLNTVARAVGEPEVSQGFTMRWIDDGKHDKKIIIKAKNKDVYKGRDWASTDDMWPPVTQPNPEKGETDARP